MRGKMRLICPTRKAEYFRGEIWTGGIALKAQTKLVFARGACRGRAIAARRPAAKDFDPLS
jgi:hypothetical protein